MMRDDKNQLRGTLSFSLYEEIFKIWLNLRALEEVMGYRDVWKLTVCLKLEIKYKIENKYRDFSAMSRVNIECVVVSRELMKVRGTQ